MLKAEWICFTLIIMCSYAQMTLTYTQSKILGLFSAIRKQVTRNPLKSRRIF